MNTLIKTIAFASLILSGSLAQGKGTAEYFCYTSSHDNGRGGMRVAVRNHPDSVWRALNGKRGVVRSDFGSLKTMYGPRLSYGNGKWTATWFLDKEGTAMAMAESDDMTVWRPQKFFSAADSSRLLPTSLLHPAPTVEVVEGDTMTGFKGSMPSHMADYYQAASEYRGRLHRGRGETLRNDSVTFAGLGTVKAHIAIDASDPLKVSDMLIGAFFEDINYSADGGLYAELVQNRDFEYRAADGNSDPNWNAMYAWEISGPYVKSDILTDNPIHPNNPHFLRIKAGSGNAVVKNSGFGGIPVKASEPYDFTLRSRCSGGKKTPLEVALRARDGKVLCRKTLQAGRGDWGTGVCTLLPKETADSAVLEITVPAGMEVDLDMVSLFPRHTFKGRKNGLRADMAQLIADMKPKFLRFPGGCLVHGDGLDNIYHWKETVGPLEARKPAANIWRYHQTRGLGYHEYFQFCEDIGAEPLPVVAAGVSCQNSGTGGPSHYSHDLVTSYGQMGGIPMEEMGAYVQDVLDLIEWANGDPSTKWGAVRAAAGHPEPFGLKYIGIGNEDLISDVFEERFEMICKAVKERYPEITVIGTTGPFVEGSDYEAGWELARSLGIDMVDEHNYNTPGWFINNRDFYDRYPRSGPKVYLGEYAVHVAGRHPTAESALVNALFLTDVERNSDVVRMTSYAPLFARHGHTQWNPDMIYFDGTSVYPTADYEVQKLFGCNSGDVRLRSAITPEGRNPDIERRLGVSALRDSETGDLIIKIVNCLPTALATTMDLPEGTDGKFVKTIFSGKPSDRATECTESEVTATDMAAAVYPPYSLTLYRSIKK